MLAAISRMGLLAYEGLWLGDETFVSFDKKGGEAPYGPKQRSLSSRVRGQGISQHFGGSILILNVSQGPALVPSTT
jgi:hypothetical protein